MRLRHIVGGLAVVIAATCTMSAIATAATVTPRARPIQQLAAWHPAFASAAAGQVPWQSYRAKPWQDAPGKVCAFGVDASIVRDHEQYRTLSSYQNGQPRIQEFRGPLFVRYTNTSTGKSIVGNLSGYGWFYYPASGGADVYVPSHIGLTVRVGSKGFPAGEWIINGQAMVIVGPSGTSNNVVLVHATTENVCRMLS